MHGRRFSMTCIGGCRFSLCTSLPSSCSLLIISILVHFHQSKSRERLPCSPLFVSRTQFIIIDAAEMEFSGVDKQM